MTYLIATYQGPAENGWVPGATYELQIRRNGRWQFHVGTTASHNMRRGLANPVPLRFVTLRRFLDTFVLEESGH